MGVTIQLPDKVDVHKVDQIFVASMYSNQICNQLVNELKVDQHKIKLVDKATLHGKHEKLNTKLPVLVLMAFYALVVLFFVLSLKE
ncbi:hypothetical protein [Bowmanella denitrificans]|uniref:hypothetical protein n=1 Tax=Bowmanella denitrificans TaxID=366582 RepID=UPI0011AEDF88|nr:hypothetical protein [Bowmanella denitrificans]